ncbi:UDP-N-acetylmuramate--L-alanine ligase [Candidatus Roizmanbacteria bacterium RIFCSPHIGHO2_01_FULL_39_12b]|uniref:UDP-N-acetylmuramate--L-alanine ligase n=1 Tax=Candidatus Roizmanbacteria bacterium RIFCSPHIGHO2_01_FULL_39_12b TaxID=1802030 RepID=A0A1F7GDS7_9BACT|nr:MAG: UDP-N-acetylmuramate--L-alanine ligase [Candidatus Roizmanbacteria bacterium RIFCSPHIGHO2_01_FULL_39_12b]OGK46644.1 MAG: UDP-N-acetylmuramate--L-alanine ligase [Candidatus Roizmanbacteria bacterium RIFCSPLOWO2_01_FULL_39_19]
MTLYQAKTVYLIGIRGVGMAALACVLQDMGKNILGSDVVSSHNTPTDLLLKKRDIKVFEEFDEKHINNSVDFVVTPTLFNGPDNIEAKQAYKLNVDSATYAKAVGIVMNWSTTRIAVCGSHGKTTTTALIANVFNDLKLKSTYIVGASEFNNGISGGGSTGEDFCVVEADEYVTSVGFNNMSKFLYQNPSHILCTNIDFDHPDVFSSLKEVRLSFETFFEENIKDTEKNLFYCVDNQALNEVVKENNLEGISFGLSDKAEYQARNIEIIDGQFKFDVYRRNLSLTSIKMLLKGDHNISNMTGVVALTHTLGLDIDKVSVSLSQFSPAQRRLQKLYENKVTYYDDYAHHPTEIKSSLIALKNLYPEKKIIVIFEPHTIARTYALKYEFVESLKYADYVFILPIYTSVREKQDNIKITSEDLVNLSKKKGVGNLEFVESEDVIDKLLNEIRPKDLVVTMGAGDKVYFLRDTLIKTFKENNF